MLTTLALLSALSLPANQTDKLTVTNVRSTYGVLGAARPDDKVLPGDSYVLSFDIEGVKVADDGKVLYSVGMEVTDSDGKAQFKQDPRDGEYKLLDVNARVWGFHGLGPVAGVDFPYLLFADQCGMQVAPARGKSGLGWMRLLPDVPLVLSNLADGYLTLGAYWHSLKATGVESVFSRQDPAPSIAEFVLLPYFIKKKYSKQYSLRHGSDSRLSHYSRPRILFDTEL